MILLEWVWAFPPSWLNIISRSLCEEMRRSLLLFLLFWDLASQDFNRSRMSAFGSPVHASELYINKPSHPRWLTGRPLGLQNYRSQQTSQPTPPLHTETLRPWFMKGQLTNSQLYHGTKETQYSVKAMLEVLSTFCPRLDNAVGRCHGTVSGF